jgi:multicomponent K+:H+ antiporter subunit E
MLGRLFPHPMLSLTLLLIWFALVNNVSVGHLLLGGFLGIALPIITEPYWPGRPKLRSPLKLAAYVLMVIWDIVLANIDVAKIILFKKPEDVRSHWINVPLDLTSAEAITVLAGTITMTPGTISAMLSADARCILVHCLHTDDPDAVRDEIKSRYESRLKEIFP